MQLSLPTSWAGVTIAQYYKLITIHNLYKEDAVERSIKMLALFSDKTEKEIEQMNVANVTREASRLSFLNEMPTDTKLAVTFKLKEKEYKAVLITADMQAGQFMDFSHCGKECTPEELPYHMHELIACMCLSRKGKWSWQYVPYTEIADDFLEMPMSIAHAYYLFFCKVLINLQQPILESSLKHLKKVMKKDMKLTEKILESV